MGFPRLLLFAAVAIVSGQTFEDAVRLQQQGRYAEAEKALKSLIQKGAETPETLANLGAVLAAQDKLDEAIAAYRKALKRAPGLAPLHLNLGLAYFKQGDYAAAARSFSVFLKAQPGNRQALQLRAICAIETEQFEDAVRDYQALMPSADLGIRLGLATAYTRLGRTAQAREVLGPAIRNEDSAEVQFLLGQALAEDGDLDGALAAFEKARALNPKLPRLWLQIGAIHWKKRDTDAAIEAWREEYKTNPSAFASNYTLGAALALSRQDQAEAERLLRAALRLRPDHSGTLYHLGKLLWQRSRSPEAVAMLERAVKSNGELREARYLLATAYQTLGRKAEAAREFAEVKRLSEQELKRTRDLFESEQ
jgi:tetratricopeptide (TPR) repeat protein